MNHPDEKYVFHGSHERFETVVPKWQRRLNSKQEVIFDEVSFHATSYRWIGLAYIANGFMGVDLYDYEETIEIVGWDSLEKSLGEIYGKGGYLFSFEKEKFFHKLGLGNLELITKEALAPLKVEWIEDPVGELKQLGIEFKFINLNDPKHADLRKYYELNVPPTSRELATGEFYCHTPLG